MQYFILSLLVIGFILYAAAKRSNAQDEFEVGRAEYMVQLSSDYDYRSGCFRGQFKPSAAGLVEMQTCP